MASKELQMVLEMLRPRPDREGLSVEERHGGCRGRSR